MRSCAFFAALLCLCLPIAAEAAQVRDAMGREVVLEAPATRVAVVAPFAVDVLLDLGVEPILRPTVQGPTPQRWGDIEELPVAHSSGPDLERLIAARPDLVVLDLTFARFARAIEQTAGVPCVICDTRSIEDVRTNIRNLGDLVGKTSQAADRVAAFDAKLAQVARRVAERDRHPRVFAMFGTPGAFYGFLPGSYLGALCEFLGVQLVAPGGEESRTYQGFANVGLESVIAANPEIVLVVRHGPPSDGERKLTGHPAWNSLSAVRGGKVHRLDEALYVMYPGTRVVEAIEALESLLFGEDEAG